MMKKKKKTLQVATLVAGAALALTAGIAGGGAVASGLSDDHSANFLVEVNEAGQTFGSGDVPEGVKLPDLIRVYGDKGLVGYVEETDLNPPAPSSPEEAAAQAERDYANPPVLDVFLSDGKTKIDTFTLTRSEDAEPVKD